MRFYSLHFVLPFINSFLVLLHFIFLHQVGSSNPHRVNGCEKLHFFPYILLKDVVGFSVGIFFSYFLVFSAPSFFLEEQNFIMADFLVTPQHIQPEWYFLSAYAVLRSVPNKLGGVVALVLFVCIFFFLGLMRLHPTQRLERPHLYRRFLSA